MLASRILSKATRSLVVPPRYTFTTTHKKIVDSVEKAIEDVKDGASIFMGGFGLCGIPENLINALANKGTKNLTVISDNGGTATWGPGVLLQKHAVKRMIASFIGENKVFEQQYLNGELELELHPQGTLAEKIRAGGAGITAFYTPTGVGTVVEFGGIPIKYGKDGRPVILSQPRRKEVIDGRECLLETALKADFAFIKAKKADTSGNLIFNKTARNFNYDMASAGKITIAEVEEIVETGQIGPDEAHLPGIYIDRIFKGAKFERRIEKLLFEGHEGKPGSKGDLRDKIAKRASQEMKDGMYVNLGIGIPTLLPKFLPSDVNIMYQSENGLLGMGRFPKRGEEDADLINAGKETVTAVPGATFFNSSHSFAMIRGGHLDLTVLGGMQVSQSGDLANWVVPGKKVKGMGGAMDLVASRSRVIVVMEHNAKDKSPKVLEKCTFPLTGKGIVDTLITDKAVFTFRNGKMILNEIAEGTTLDELKACTAANFEVATDLKTF